ncbi:MAG: hypothetical protein JWQ25_2234, partial [Daejeonella sp.]|nr:hypothetical protein [Daejeonella sp.]
MLNRKIKILRVITQAEVVPWHLKNFIDRSENDYQLFITGDDVSRYTDLYPYVKFIDNKIIRKVSLMKDFIALINLIITCIQVRPDIIHSIMPKAGLLSSFAGWIAFVPIRIHTFTGQVWATKSGVSRYILRFIDKLILVFCTKCLTDSPSQSNFLANNGLLKNGNPIDYLGKGSLSGVALDRFDIALLKNREVLKEKL